MQGFLRYTPKKMHYDRTFNISRLYFKFLEKQKIPVSLTSEFARRLHARGFIDTIGNDRYSECDKIKNKAYNDELYRIVHELGKEYQDGFKFRV